MLRLGGELLYLMSMLGKLTLLLSPNIIHFALKFHSKRGNVTCLFCVPFPVILSSAVCEDEMASMVWLPVLAGDGFEESWNVKCISHISKNLFWFGPGQIQLFESLSKLEFGVSLPYSSAVTSWQQLVTGWSPGWHCTADHAWYCSSSGDSHLCKWAGRALPGKQPWFAS